MRWTELCESRMAPLYHMMDYEKAEDVGGGILTKAGQLAGAPFGGFIDSATKPTINSVENAGHRIIADMNGSMEARIAQLGDELGATTTNFDKSMEARVSQLDQSMERRIYQLDGVIGKSLLEADRISEARVRQLDKVAEARIAQAAADDED